MHACALMSMIFPYHLINLANICVQLRKGILKVTSVNISKIQTTIWLLINDILMVMIYDVSRIYSTTACQS